MSAHLAPPNPRNTKAPPAMTVVYQHGDDQLENPVPQRNYRVVQNMAGIEIQELKEALAYAEYQLCKSQTEKEQLQKDTATQMFALKEKDDRIRQQEDEKDQLQREVDRQISKVDMAQKN
jgi:predicted nuclease with TOPRIM domain